jgi:uncharacterized protein (DUF58 family)
MDRQAWRDFFITLFLLGIAFVIALLSSVAAQQRAPRLAAFAAAVSLLLAIIGAIYILPRLARKVQLEFLRFAVRTSVTVEGLFFTVLLIVIAFSAWNTSNNLLYLILSAMLAFLFAANLISRMSLADVSVQLRFPDHIFAGEPANLSVTVTNHKRLTPTFSLLVEALPGGDEPSDKADRRSPVASYSADGADVGALGKLAHFVLVPAGAGARQRIEHRFERRGRYPITSFRISTKFPTGFFKKWRKIDASGEIIVYPKPRPLDDLYHALPMLAGQMSSHVRGTGDDLYGLRRYYPTDHMRHIDWKATAKARELMVRDHTREDERRLTIVFDTSRPLPRWRASIDPEDRNPADAEHEPVADDARFESEEETFLTRFEAAIVMAASLTNHFIMEGADVELITPAEDHRVGSGAGSDHLHKILKSLATLQPDPWPGTGARTEESRLTARKRRPAHLGHGADQTAAGTATTSFGPAGSDRQSGVTSRAASLGQLIDDVPVLTDERRFKVLITSAGKGTIPAGVWRSAHVVFMEDM